MYYPRNPSVFGPEKHNRPNELEKSNTYPIFESHPSRLIDQHNLKDLTKFSLYRPREKTESYFPKNFPRLILRIAVKCVMGRY